MGTGVDIFLLAILGSFILRTVGFGFGIFIMTVLPFLLPSYGEATCLSGLLAMTTSVYVVVKMRRYLDWRRLGVILATFVVTSTAAIFVLKRLDNFYLRMALGIVLILIAIYFTWLSGRIKLKAGVATQVTAGALSGVLGGFFGMQGPPAVLYFLSTEPSKERYMALIQTYLLTGNVVMLAVRAASGFLTPAVGWGYLYGLGGVAIGTTVGGMVFERIPQRSFRYVVYGYIAVSGIVILATL